MTDEREKVLYSVEHGIINDRECRLRAVEHIEQAENSMLNTDAEWHAQMAQAYALLALTEELRGLAR